jgi:chromosome segregation ATPase
MMRKLLFGVLAVVLLSSFALAQSLADAAREAKKNKRTTSATNRVYTNESLSGGAAYANTTGTSSTASADAASAAADKDKAAAAPGTAKPAEAEMTPEEEKQKQVTELRDKLKGAQEELAKLKRELDVTVRENRLRAATFYADAGNRLRDEKKYAEEDRRYQAETAAKQQAITSTQKQVDDLQEQLRRLGTR